MNSVDNLSRLPPELLQSVALRLPKEDIISLCSTSKALTKLCANDYFWRDKVRVDFARYVPIRSLRSLTYKKYYELLYSTWNLSKENKFLFEEITFEFPRDKSYLDLLYPVPPLNMVEDFIEEDARVILFGSKLVLVVYRDRSTIIGSLPDLLNNVPTVSDDVLNNQPLMLDRIQQSIQVNRELGLVNAFVIERKNLNDFLKHAQQDGYVEIVYHR